MNENNIPFRNRGRSCVALIALKRHPKRLYHYSKTHGEEYSWAVRDYLSGWMVRSGRSEMTASQVEELIDYAEEPPACPVQRIDFWRDHCQAASSQHFGKAHVDSTTNNPPTLGQWTPLSDTRIQL